MKSFITKWFQCRDHGGFTEEDWVILIVSSCWRSCFFEIHALHGYNHEPWAFICCTSWILNEYVLVVFFRFFTGFYTFQVVVWDFFHQQYHWLKWTKYHQHLVDAWSLCGILIAQLPVISSSEVKYSLPNHLYTVPGSSWTSLHFYVFFGWIWTETSKTEANIQSLQHLQKLKCAWPCNSIPLQSQKFIPRYRAKLKCAWLGWTNNDRVGPFHGKLATKFPAFPLEKKYESIESSKGIIFHLQLCFFLPELSDPIWNGFILDQTNGTMPCIASELATKSCLYNG